VARAGHFRTVGIRFALAEALLSLPHCTGNPGQIGGRHLTQGEAIHES